MGLDFTCKESKCKKAYSDEERNQCKKTCDQCYAELNGVEACENQGFNAAECDAINSRPGKLDSCCQFDGMECKSNVGLESCADPARRLSATGAP